MNRHAMLFTVAAALAVGGCAGDGDGGGTTMNNPFGKKAPAASAVKSPDQADYFMVKKDGKTYVLGSNDSRTALMSGKTPAVKASAFDNGKTVYIENDEYHEYNRLVAQYKKDAGL